MRDSTRVKKISGQGSHIRSIPCRTRNVKQLRGDKLLSGLDQQTPGSTFMDALEMLEVSNWLMPENYKDLPAYPLGPIEDDIYQTAQEMPIGFKDLSVPHDRGISHSDYGPFPSFIPDVDEAYEGAIGDWGASPSLWTAVRLSQTDCAEQRTEQITAWLSLLARLSRLNTSTTP